MASCLQYIVIASGSSAGKRPSRLRPNPAAPIAIDASRKQTFVGYLAAAFRRVKTDLTLVRDLNFRGDNDEAWQRAETFLVAQIREAPTLLRSLLPLVLRGAWWWSCVQGRNFFTRRTAD